MRLAPDGYRLLTRNRNGKGYGHESSGDLGGGARGGARVPG